MARTKIGGQQIQWEDGMKLDNTPDNDHNGNGIFSIDTVGENVAIGDILYRKSDAKYWKANASAALTMPGVVMAMEAISATASGKLLHLGYYRDDSWAWTVGGLLYVPITPGNPTQTAPGGSGDQVQVLGYAFTATIVYFKPDLTLVEIA